MPSAGIQLIVYGQRARDDIESVLRDVAAIGYDGAETANLFRPPGDAERVRAIFAETGLRLCGCHAGFAEIADPEKLRENLEFLQAIGSRYLMCSGVGDRQRGLAAYRDASALFNSVGRRCRDAGVYFCYHNHAWEFEDGEDGTCGMDVLAAETDPDLVKFCIDVYWVQIGGQDPAAFVREHAGRAVYFHFKDGARDAEGKPAFTELGEGSLDVHSAYRAASETAPEWVVYEQDRTTRTPTESARISHERLRALIAGR